MSNIINFQEAVGRLKKRLSLDSPSDVPADLTALATTIGVEIHIPMSVVEYAYHDDKGQAHYRYRWSMTHVSVALLHQDMLGFLNTIQTSLVHIARYMDDVMDKDYEPPTT